MSTRHPHLVKLRGNFGVSAYEESVELSSIRMAFNMLLEGLRAFWCNLAIGLLTLDNVSGVLIGY